jgi:hypothetical protein
MHYWIGPCVARLSTMTFVVQKPVFNLIHQPDEQVPRNEFYDELFIEGTGRRPQRLVKTLETANFKINDMDSVTRQINKILLTLTIFMRNIRYSCSMFMYRP